MTQPRGRAALAAVAVAAALAAAVTVIILMITAHRISDPGPQPTYPLDSSGECPRGTQAVVAPSATPFPFECVTASSLPRCRAVRSVVGEFCQPAIGSYLDPDV